MLPISFYLRKRHQFSPLILEIVCVLILVSTLLFPLVCLYSAGAVISL